MTCHADCQYLDHRPHRSSLCLCSSQCKGYPPPPAPPAIALRVHWSLSISPRPISLPPAHTLLTQGILWVFPALLTRSHNKYPFPQHITPGQRDTEVMLCVTLLRGLQCYPGIAIFKVLDIIITS